jgi:hypothetical protein
VREFSIWLQLAVAGFAIFAAIGVGVLVQYLEHRGKINP